ncbi:helix-turn-helix domain-containing protein [Amycolatopsis cihanbeyliensis]
MATESSVVDVMTAARALGIGRTTAYALVRAGSFPCPVLRVGGVYRVPTVGLLRVLGVDPLIRWGRPRCTGSGRLCARS